MYNLMLKNHVNGCHGNHAFFHGERLSLRTQIVGIPMGRNCYPLVADLFYTATEEILLIALTMTFKLMLSRLLIRLLGTSMTF